MRSVAATKAVFGLNNEQWNALSDEAKLELRTGKLKSVPVRNGIPAKRLRKRGPNKEYRVVVAFDVNAKDYAEGEIEDNTDVVNLARAMMAGEADLPCEAEKLEIRAYRKPADEKRRKK